MSVDGREPYGQACFTPAQAEALLPRLAALLTRLQALQAEARQRYQEMGSIRAVGTRPDGRLVMDADFQRARRDFGARVDDAKAILAELHDRGCRLTDVDLGLVDFPAQVEGEPVFLCWRLGEPRVAYYHRRDEGFTHRRPL